MGQAKSRLNDIAMEIECVQLLILRITFHPLVIIFSKLAGTLHEDKHKLLD